MANCSPQVLFASVGFHPGPLAVSEWWERKKVPIGIAIQLAKFESYLVQRRFGYVPNTGPDDQALADIVAGKLTP